MLAGGMLLCGRLLARAARTPLDTALARACSVEAPAALHRTTEVDPRWLHSTLLSDRLASSL